MQLDKNNQYCWVSASLCTVGGDPKKVPVTQPKLPYNPDTPDPTCVAATRKGSTVTITWCPAPLAPSDSHGYFLDMNICKNGLYINVVAQTDNTTYIVTDDQNCSKASKGKVYTVSTRGYSNPVQIPWP